MEKQDKKKEEEAKLEKENSKEDGEESHEKGESVGEGRTRLFFLAVHGWKGVRPKG